MKSLKLLILVFLGLGVSSKAWSQYRDLYYFETYLQYIPIAVDATLGLCGVPCDQDFLERGAAIGTTFISGTILIQSCKHLIPELRPDGSNYQSFPSGHTCYAVAAAELIRYHYGWGWGSVAYASAATVGAMRIIRQRHHWWDVLAGAGMGFGLAHLGIWAAPKWKHLLDPEDKWHWASYVEPQTGVLCAQLSYNF